MKTISYCKPSKFLLWWLDEKPIEFVHCRITFNELYQEIPEEHLVHIAQMKVEEHIKLDENKDLYRAQEYKYRESEIKLFGRTTHKEIE